MYVLYCIWELGSPDNCDCSTLLKCMSVVNPKQLKCSTLLFTSTVQVNYVNSTKNSFTLFLILERAKSYTFPGADFAYE